MPANNYLRAATLMLPFLAAAPLATPPAHAQRPALVKNIDEKGRTPFAKTFTCGGSSGACTISYPAVPANKRLVVEYVNGTFVPVAGGTPSMVLYALINHEASYSFLPAFVSSNVWIENSFTLAYFEAADSPQLLIFGVDNASITLAGYLVDLSE